MDRFILDGEHAVIDRETNLMWARTDSMNDLEKWVNYQESVDYIRNLCEKKMLDSMIGGYLLEKK